jgi:hypothetical protein
MTTDRPWFVGLRKLIFALAVLLSLDSLAAIGFLDSAQYIAALAGIVAAFFGVNYLNGKDGKQ